jgi:hypothetical protein
MYTDCQLSVMSITQSRRAVQTFSRDLTFFFSLLLTGHRSMHKISGIETIDGVGLLQLSPFSFDLYRFTFCD